MTLYKIVADYLLVYCQSNEWVREIDRPNVLDCFTDSLEQDETMLVQAKLCQNITNFPKQIVNYVPTNVHIATYNLDLEYGHILNWDIGVVEYVLRRDLVVPPLEIMAELVHLPRWDIFWYLHFDKKMPITSEAIRATICRGWVHEVKHLVMHGAIIEPCHLELGQRVGSREMIGYLLDPIVLDPCTLCRDTMRERRDYVEHELAHGMSF